MQDVERWAVLTIGTGLGNAHFTNRPSANEKKDAQKSKKKDREKSRDKGTAPD
jgi:hypothetical protein